MIHKNFKIQNPIGLKHFSYGTANLCSSSVFLASPSLVCPSELWLFGIRVLCFSISSCVPLFLNIPFYFRKHITYISLIVNEGGWHLKSFTAEKECLTWYLLNWKNIYLYLYVSVCMLHVRGCPRKPEEVYAINCWMWVLWVELGSCGRAAFNC